MSGKPELPQRWSVVAWGGLSAIGVAWAATYTSLHSTHAEAGSTAWICAAIIGTASVISAAASRMRRPFD